MILNSAKMLSNNILVEKRRERLEDVPLLLSKDENMDTENKTYITNIDCGKEAILPHSRTIQEIIENSVDSRGLVLISNAKSGRLVLSLSPFRKTVEFCFLFCLVWN